MASYARKYKAQLERLQPDPPPLGESWIVGPIGSHLAPPIHLTTTITWNSSVHINPRQD